MQPLMLLPDQPAADTSALSLRPYQQEIMDQARGIIEQDANARIFIQAPTGGGKTEMAAWLVSDQGLFPGRDACFVVHRQELAGQTVKRLQKYGLPVMAGSATGSHGLPVAWKDKAQSQPPGIIVIGVDSWINRASAGSTDPDCLLIIDEAHTTGGNERRQAAFRSHQGPLIALSATPDRMSRHEDFHGLCDHMICGPQNRQLMDEGWLAEFQLHGSQRAAAELAKHKQRSGESGDQWAQRVFESSETLRGVFTETAAQMWLHHPQRREDSKTLAFGCSIAHVERLQALLAEAGCRAVILKGEHNAAERTAIMAEFEQPNDDGGAEVLLNVSMVREGFDCPEADILMCVRPTDSIPLWRQMCGRVFRIKPDGRPALILDLADNWARHGLPDEDMNWTLSGAEERKPGRDPEMVCMGAVRMDGDYIGEYPNHCRCGEGNHKPEDCGCIGRTPCGHHANAFTVGVVDGEERPEGCGVVNSPGRYRCAGCGAQFRKACPAAPDGCGRERSVKRWSGRFKRYRPGACDDCGEREQSVAGALSGDAAANLEWIAASTGNGSNLRLAPSPEYYQEQKRSGNIWAGHRKGSAAAHLFPAPEPDDPRGWQILGERISSEVNGHGYTLPQVRREVIRVLIDEYRVQGNAALSLFGAMCRSCGVRLRPARFDTCWPCKRDGPPHQKTADDLLRESYGQWKSGQFREALSTIESAWHAPGGDERADRISKGTATILESIRKSES